MNPSEEPKSKPISDMAKLMLDQPNHPLVRQQKCYDAIRESLREYDCQIAISMRFIDGKAIPDVTIVPVTERRDIL